MSTPSIAFTRNTPWPRFFAAFCCVLGLWFFLYASLGKGFGAAGFAPIYVGEILLALAGVVLIASRRLTALIRTPLGVLLLIFVAWQIACAVPYLNIYGLDVLRDGVIWGYGLIAWATASMVLRLKGMLRSVLTQFARFSRIFLFVGPLAWILTSYWRESLPVWGGTDTTIPLLKGDEYSVHLAGIFAFLLQGMGLEGRLWIILILADAFLAMSVRSGLAAFIVASTVAILMRPRLDRVLPIILTFVLLGSAMAAFEVRLAPPVADRELSLTQFVRNLQSVVGSSDSQLEGTKQWRLNWWRKIWDYTAEGPYFWTGKGYGINLADSDGFPAGNRDEPLRSPHSSHLTILARSGVPGGLLWLAVQIAWIGAVLRAYFAARRYGAHEWVGIFGWLTAYWLAFMVAASFDVFLEGPMAGIPYWTVFGLGWGAQVLFQSQVRRREFVHVAR